jgi:hypothetical protein
MLVKPNGSQRTLHHLVRMTFRPGCNRKGVRLRTRFFISFEGSTEWPH